MPAASSQPLSVAGRSFVTRPAVSAKASAAVLWGPAVLLPLNCRKPVWNGAFAPAPRTAASGTSNRTVEITRVIFVAAHQHLVRGLPLAADIGIRRQETPTQPRLSLVNPYRVRQILAAQIHGRHGRLVG